MFLWCSKCKDISDCPVVLGFLWCSKCKDVSGISDCPAVLSFYGVLSVKMSQVNISDSQGV